MDADWIMWWEIFHLLEDDIKTCVLCLHLLIGNNYTYIMCEDKGA